MKTADYGYWFVILTHLKKTPRHVSHLVFYTPWIVKQITETRQELPLHHTNYGCEVLLGDSLCKQESKRRTNCASWS